MPSIFTPSFEEVLTEAVLGADAFVSIFGAVSALSGTDFLTGVDFLTAFFGARVATTGVVFFGTTFSTLAFKVTFFAGAVFGATGDFSFADAFFVGLFFVWVFIREILGKDFRKSKISSLFDIFLYNANIYSHSYKIFMLDKNFTPPKERIAITATKKRVDIIESIINTLAKCSTSTLLTGSMAYGQDFSVTPESDIDLQLTITAD